MNPSGLVREARAHRGMTQEQLAARLALDVDAVRRMEDDAHDRHTLTSLGKVAAALGFTIHLQFVVNPEWKP